MPADQASVAGPNATDFGSRPSKTNCKNSGGGGERSASWDDAWWRRKNEIVDRFLEEMPDRAARPVSVRSRLLREECVRRTTVGSDDDSPYQSRTWAAVLREFLDWYNGYRHSHLVFRSPEGDRVRAPMINSHMPQYGDKYYARLKALERQMVARYHDLHVTMLTLTGSSSNANGGWRCPADHLRDVIDSWRPGDGSGVYHKLRYQLRDFDWEYALVVEKHQSGYGHVHVAIFTDGAVEAEQFHPAIDAHLEHCDIAGAKAHNYYAPDVEDRPISISRVDPSIDLSDLEDDARRDLGEVANIGSYIGEYIGTHGEPLFDRELDELIFRSAMWATGSQMVRFSAGANEMIADDLDDQGDDQDEREHLEAVAELYDGLSADDLADMPISADGPILIKDLDYEPDGPNGRRDSSRRSPFTLLEGEWSIEGVGRVDAQGEDIYDIDRTGIVYEEIKDSSHIDPPARQPFRRPKPRIAEAKLADY